MAAIAPIGSAGAGAQAGPRPQGRHRRPPGGGRTPSRAWTASLAALASLAVSACAALPQAPSPVEPSPFSAAWDGEAGDAARWTRWLSEDLENHRSALVDLIPADAAEFCETWPRLTRRGREQVWITLISAMAKHESDFDPRASFDEPPPLSERSIGLLQLSLSDAVEFRCDFTTEVQIEDARRNLDCAVQILATLVPRDGVVGGGSGRDRLGAAGYWSVLNMRGHADARAFIVAQTTALPICIERRRPQPPQGGRLAQERSAKAAPPP